MPASIYKLHVHLDRGKLDNIPSSVRQQLNVALRKAAIEIRNAVRNAAPKDKGALAASVYAVAPGYNSYASAVAKASLLRPGVKWLSRDEAEESSARVPNVAIIAMAAPYGGYVEYGTSRNSAQPFFYRTIDEYRYKYFDIINQAVAKGVESA